MNNETTNTTADVIADMLDNDGMRFHAEVGQSFDDLCLHFGATAEYFSRRHTGNGQYVYESGYRGGYIDGDPIRYEFRDGSVLVVAGDGWDHEGPEPFSWRG